MKALELTVYPKNGFGYQVPLRVWSPASCDPDDDFRVVVSEDDIQKRIESKRLTDAELAAEYWQAFSGVWDGHGKKARMRRETIERFATLPSYDEVTA